MPKKTTEERFWEKVNKQFAVDACWLWTGFLNKDRYGRFGVKHGQKIELAHRFLGKLLTDLFRLELVFYISAITRHAFVQIISFWAVIKTILVDAIRKMYIPGIITQKEVARCFGISRETVSQITLKKRWRSDR